MVPAVAVQATTALSANTAWASVYVARVREHVATSTASLKLGNDSGPAAAAPAATEGTGTNRDWLDGVTLDRPGEMASTFLTNVVESVTGTRDARVGRALTQVGLAGYQFIQAGLHYAAQGTGLLAAGSSVLGKVLPAIGVASGAAQVWQGWNELESHDGGVLSVIGSRTARSGLLNMAAGVLSFVPGFGTAIGGAVTRLVAAANEMDMFSFLDAPTRTVESQGTDVARTVHPLDETPTNPYDRTRRDGTVVRAS